MSHQNRLWISKTALGLTPTLPAQPNTSPRLILGAQRRIKLARAALSRSGLTVCHRHRKGLQHPSGFQVSRPLAIRIFMSLRIPLVIGWPSAILAPPEGLPNFSRPFEVSFHGSRFRFCRPRGVSAKRHPRFCWQRCSRKSMTLRSSTPIRTLADRGLGQRRQCPAWAHDCIGCG